LLIYARLKPFPTEADMSWMFICAGAAQLAVLGVVRILRAVAERRTSGKPAGSGKPARSGRPAAAAVAKAPALAGLGGRHPSPVKAEDMRDRMKLAMRAGPGTTKR